MMEQNPFACTHPIPILTDVSFGCYCVYGNSLLLSVRVRSHAALQLPPFNPYPYFPFACLPPRNRARALTSPKA